MVRRSRLIAAALLIHAVLALPAAAQKRRASPRISEPSVILITIDTLRPDHLGCYGYKKIKTPNIDAFAHDGVRFDRAYSAVPITLPSHATMFTGSYPMVHGVHDFSGNRLNPKQPTLASILKARGYHTAGVIGAAVLDSRFGLDSGFDFYYDEFDFNRLLETNLDAMERPGNLVVDQAIAWLEKNRTSKFLLWVHIYEPHHPYKPPAPFDAEYKNNPYDGEIAFADAQVGRLLRYLKQHGTYDPSLVVVAGDHGEGLGEHQEQTHGFFIYDSTTRVPLIIKEPRTKSPPAKPRVNDTLLSLVDLMPTMLDLLGIKESHPQIQGKTLAALIRGNGDVTASPVYSETYLPRLHFNWSELRGLHTGDYHLIDAPKPELFNLTEDPREQTNIYAARKAVSEELRGMLAGVIRDKSASTELAEKTSLDPAMMERLKALGYAAVPSGASATLSDKTLADPKDRVQLYDLISSAIEDSQHSRFDASVSKLLKVLETEKDSVPVHYLLGLNYYKKGAFAEAVTQFNKVLELSPEYALAAYYLGLSYVKNADWDAAIDAFQRALKLDPTNFSAAYNLGATYLQKKMFAEALAAFRQAVQLNPEYYPAQVGMGELQLFLKDPDAAIEALKRATQLAPKDPRSHFLLAQAYQAKGRYQLALEAMRTAERLRNQRPN